MIPRLVRADTPAPQPWRNGRGRMRELLAWPSPSHWQLRVSVADIESDGPFSAFPGVQRWFVVIEGAGVLLNGRPLHPRDAPWAFDGAEAPDCRLIQGRTLNLNLILARDARGALHAARERISWTPDAPRCGFFAARPGWLTAGADPWSLPARTLAWFDEAPHCALTFCTGDANPGTMGWWLSFTAEEYSRR